MECIEGFDKYTNLTTTIMEIAKYGVDSGTPIRFADLKRVYIILEHLGRYLNFMGSVEMVEKLIDLQDRIVNLAAERSLLKRRKIDEKALLLKPWRYESIFVKKVLNTHIKLIEQRIPKLQIWKIEKNENECGFLTGIVHEQFPIDQENENLNELDYFFDCINDCNALAVELDITDPTILAQARECVDQERSSQETQKFCRENNMTAIGFPPDIRMPTLSMAESIEGWLCVSMKEDGLPVISLENAKEQITTSWKSTLHCSRNPKKSVTGYYWEQEKKIDILISWYFGNYKKGFELISQDTGFMQELRERNVRIADKIDEIFNTQQLKPFITVGFLHLKGEGGLLALLRRKGYKLTKIKKTEEVF